MVINRRNSYRLKGTGQAVTFTGIVRHIATDELMYVFYPIDFADSAQWIDIAIPEDKLAEHLTLIPTQQSILETMMKTLED